jgi:hypothetical protein
MREIPSNLPIPSIYLSFILLVFCIWCFVFVWCFKKYVAFLLHLCTISKYSFQRLRIFFPQRGKVCKKYFFLHMNISGWKWAFYRYLFNWILNPIFKSAFCFETEEVLVWQCPQWKLIFKQWMLSLNFQAKAVV